MYSILNESSEYYNCNEYNAINNNDITNKDCIICWLPSTQDSPVKCMKEYSYFISNCKCNAFFHDNCFKTWLKLVSSCPICRTKISINIIENDDKYIKITTYSVIFLNYAFYILRMISFFSMINIACIIFYNILFFDYTLDFYPDERNHEF